MDVEEINSHRAGQDRTFITDVLKGSKEPTSSEKINIYYAMLNDQVAKLDSHIDSVLQKHEEDFLNAFKCQMFTLYTQLKELKKQTDENELKLKKDEQLNKLQSSLEWFRDEAVHLGEATQLYKKEADKWKAKADSLEDDRKFLEEQLRCAKKRIKELKASKFAEVAEKSVSSSRSRAGSVLSDRRFVPSSKSGLIIMEMAQKNSVRDGSFFYELEKFLNDREAHYKEAVKQAKTSLGSERKKLLNVSVHQSSVFFEKSELESLFLECVDEVRQEVIKRRTSTISNQKYTKRAKSTQRSEKASLTHTDKHKILELLVSNEKVLVLIYEKLFPHKVNPYSNIVRNEVLVNEPLPLLEEMMRQVPTRPTTKASETQQRTRFLSKL